MNQPHNSIEQAFREFLEKNAPARSEHWAKEFAAVRAAIDEKGEWHADEEWRMLTFFKVSIRATQANGKPWFHVAVECDGQVLSCGCPTLERAFMYSQLYRRIIVGQFYSIGPPWA